MKQTAVEKLVAHLIEYGFDLSAHKLEIEQAKEKENEQKGYSEEEVQNILIEYVKTNPTKPYRVVNWFEQFKKK